MMEEENENQSDEESSLPCTKEEFRVKAHKLMDNKDKISKGKQLTKKQNK